MKPYLHQTIAPSVASRARRLRCIGLSTVCALSHLLCFAHDVRGDELHLRDGKPSVIGETVSIGWEGVTYLDQRNRSVVYSWDRVRGLDTQSTEHIDAYAEYAEFADAIWRARSRVERHDYQLAEPVLETLFAEAEGRTNESALVIVEGLLRCRLARDDRAGAVVPWLETVRIRRTGVSTTAYESLESVLDPRSMLCSDLPPVWPKGRPLDVMIDQLEQYVPINSPVTEALSEQYRRAAWSSAERTGFVSEFESLEIDGADRDRETVPGKLEEFAAVTYLRVVVDALELATATNPESNDVQDAIRALGKWCDDAGWSGAWALYARGFLRTALADPVERSLGLVDLLRLPSEHAETDARLARMALVRAIAVLESQGQVNDAASLRRDLNTRFSDRLTPGR